MPISRIVDLVVVCALNQRQRSLVIRPLNVPMVRSSKRKSESMKLGRPVAGAKNLKLDKHADKIDGYLAKGINKVAIAKLLDVSPNTLYEWLKVRRSGSTPAP
jgi:hypothetical protein